MESLRPILYLAELNSSDLKKMRHFTIRRRRGLTRRMIAHYEWHYFPTHALGLWYEHDDGWMQA
jgi:hypothetical protein